MGEVYQVRNVLSDRIEAIKVLSSGLQANLDLQDRFLREIKISAALRHPHIAELRTAQRVEGLLIMVMEFVDGVTVDALLRNGAIPAKNALHYVGQVLDALAYAHGHDVVHRDIKPQNIMVVEGDDVHLMDFGIARSLTDQGMTMTGMTLGSLYYMSPEQIRGEQVDARADIYSVGITLYEMATGSKPFEGVSGYTVMAAHLDQPPLPPVERNPQLPDALNDVILKAIEKRPDDRFQDAASFLSAVLRLQGSLPGGLSTELFRNANASRLEHAEQGRVVPSGIGSPTQTMPVTPTLPGGRSRIPVAAAQRDSSEEGRYLAESDQPHSTARPDSKDTASVAVRFGNWVAIIAMLMGLVTLILVLGPRYFPPGSPEQGIREGSGRRPMPPEDPSARPPAPGDSAAIVSGRGPEQGRSSRPPDEELLQVMQDTEAALQEAGIDVAMFGPDAREGRRFVALERAEAMLSVARRFGEAHVRQEALSERRRALSTLVPRMPQADRQPTMAAIGEQWRQVSEKMAAAEASIKSQNLRLAGEELAVAEVSIAFLETTFSSLEAKYGETK